MSPCQKCLENSWRYEYNEGWIKAICDFCENEVEFASKKLKKQLEKSSEQPSDESA